MHGICWKQSVSGMWEEHCGSAQGVCWEPTAITQEARVSAKQDLGKEGVERSMEGSPPASQLCQRVPLQPRARVLSHSVTFNQLDNGGGRERGVSWLPGAQSLLRDSRHAQTSEGIKERRYSLQTSVFLSGDRAARQQSLALSSRKLPANPGSNLSHCESVAKFLRFSEHVFSTEGRLYPYHTIVTKTKEN